DLSDYIAQHDGDWRRALRTVQVWFATATLRADDSAGRRLIELLRVHLDIGPPDIGGLVDYLTHFARALYGMLSLKPELVDAIGGQQRLVELADRVRAYGRQAHKRDLGAAADELRDLLTRPSLTTLRP